MTSRISRGDEGDTPTDPGWPRTFVKDDNEVLLYQPQIDEWKDYAQIKFRQALAMTLKGEPGPIFGVLAISAKTLVNQESRTVMITELDVDVRFPDADPKVMPRLEATAREVLPKKKFLVVSLDRVLAYLDNEPAKVAIATLNLDPPPIYRSQSPAVLVMFMGPPQFKPIANTRLMFAVNTNWDVLMDQTTSQYYLLCDQTWLTAPNPVDGPWSAAKTLPADIAKLPADENWDDVRKQLPLKVALRVPKIYASTRPAELIVTDGAPAYSPISGTRLMYVSNPEMPLFLNSADNTYYYLVAGRWFRAKTLDGPWSAASTTLPAEFSNIPDDSPMSDVLASVPNTQDAKDAVLIASIPQTAEVNISNTYIDVTYEGAANFVAIEGTPMTYAVNTQYSVIYADNKYYCCYQGVWFVSSQSAGPWAVCASVPSVIYTIPPACPLYNVTYVRVYSSTPTTVVVGYTSGYSGAYVAATGTLMFGAGMIAGAIIANNNDNWYHSSSAYFSYGSGARYRYGSGGFYRGATVYGPYGGAGRSAAYNPVTGNYSRGAYRYGPNGAAGAREAYNPYTDTYRARAGASNGYRSWEGGVVSRGDDWVRGAKTSSPRGSAGWVETSEGNAAAGARGRDGGVVAKNRDGDVYAGKDGNVYRKSDGQWQKRENGDWQDPDKSRSNWADQRQSMAKDSQARSRGNQMESRSREAQPRRSSGASRARRNR